MYCLSGICFVCLKDCNSLIKLVHKDADAEKSTVEQVNYFLPEITMFELESQPVYICSLCVTAVHSCYTFKKMCLENYERFKNYLKVLQGTTNTQVPKCGELKIIMNNHKNLVNQELMVVNKIDIEEENEETFLSSEKQDVHKNVLEHNTKELNITISNHQKLTKQDIDLIITEDNEDLWLSIEEQDDQKSSVEDYDNEEQCNKDLWLPPQEQDDQKSFVKDYINIKEELNIIEKKKDVLPSLAEQDVLVANIDINEKLALLEDQNFYQFLNCDSVVNEEDSGSSSSDNSSEDEYQDITIFNTSEKNINNFECTICVKTFSYKSSLERHMKLHRYEFQCSTCNKQFTNKRSLEQHLKSYDFKCSICNKLFNQRYLLRRHMKFHRGIKDFKCSICDKQFMQKHALQQHIQVHEVNKKFKCQICNKTFKQNYVLRRHMKVHQTCKEFECSLCNKTFRENYVLQRHMRLHQDKKKFECHICNKMYTENNYLQRHMKSHAKKKDFKCTLCNKEFTRNYSLTRHMKFHKVTKDFECQFCKQQFEQNSDLQKHLETHTEIVDCDKNNSQQLLPKVDYLIIYS